MQGDAWTTDRFPTRNYGTDSVLRINSTPVKRAFLRFELPGPGGAVQQAFLRVFAQSGAAQGFRVYAVSPAWTEGGLTHTLAPALGALVATVDPFTATNSWRSIDVTGAVPASGGVGFAIVQPAAQSDIVLASKESGQAAQLEVLVEVADPPVNTASPGITVALRVGETLTPSRERGRAPSQSRSPTSGSAAARRAAAAPTCPAPSGHPSCSTRSTSTGPSACARSRRTSSPRSPRRRPRRPGSPPLPCRRPPQARRW